MCDAGLVTPLWQLFDRLTQELGFPPPEILFDRNLVAAYHEPSGTGIVFRTGDALRGAVGELHGFSRPELVLKRYDDLCPARVDLLAILLLFSLL